MRALTNPLRFVRDWFSWWRRGFQPPYPVLVKRRTIERYLEPRSVFIETGTFLGETTKWASRRVATVHTIELSETLYNRIAPGLRSRGIHAHLGDSLTMLPRILEETDADSLVLWLDAHWSGAITGRADYGNTPILSELREVEQWMHAHPSAYVALLVDDIREFENDDDYPGFESLLEFARRNGLRVHVANDIFVAVREADDGA